MSASRASAPSTSSLRSSGTAATTSGTISSRTGATSSGAARSSAPSSVRTHHSGGPAKKDGVSAATMMLEAAQLSEMAPQSSFAPEQPKLAVEDDNPFGFAEATTGNKPAATSDSTSEEEDDDDDDDEEETGSEEESEEEDETSDDELSDEDEEDEDSDDSLPAAAPAAAAAAKPSTEQQPQPIQTAPAAAAAALSVAASSNVPAVSSSSSLPAIAKPQPAVSVAPTPAAAVPAVVAAAPKPSAIPAKKEESGSEEEEDDETEEDETEEEDDDETEEDDDDEEEEEESEDEISDGEIPLSSSSNITATGPASATKIGGAAATAAAAAPPAQPVDQSEIARRKNIFAALMKGGSLQAKQEENLDPLSSKSPEGDGFTPPSSPRRSTRPSASQAAGAASGTQEDQDIDINSGAQVSPSPPKEKRVLVWNQPEEPVRPQRIEEPVEATEVAAMDTTVADLKLRMHGAPIVGQTLRIVVLQALENGEEKEIDLIDAAAEMQLVCEWHRLSHTGEVFKVNGIINHSTSGRKCHAFILGVEDLLCTIQFSVLTGGKVMKCVSTKPIEPTEAVKQIVALATKGKKKAFDVKLKVSDKAYQIVTDKSKLKLQQEGKTIRKSVYGPDVTLQPLAEPLCLAVGFTPTERPYEFKAVSQEDRDLIILSARAYAAIATKDKAAQWWRTTM